MLGAPPGGQCAALHSGLQNCNSLQSCRFYTVSTASTCCRLIGNHKTCRRSGAPGEFDIPGRCTNHRATSVFLKLKVYSVIVQRQIINIYSLVTGKQKGVLLKIDWHSNADEHDQPEGSRMRKNRRRKEGWRRPVRTSEVTLLQRSSQALCGLVSSFPPSILHELVNELK